MSARDLVRTLILKTNPYWPFSRCNRMPYALAIRALVETFRKLPEIRGIYLRNGLVAGQWIPAMSDIDISILIQKELTAEQEYGFLESFWKKYAGLKRFFPMLGEVEILNEAEFATWLSYTSCTPGPREWVLLHGKRDAGLAGDGSPCWRRRSLNLALYVYMDLLPPCFAVPSSFLRQQDIQRRIRKIMRQLGPVLAEAGWSFGAADAKGVADAVVALDRAVGYLDSFAPGEDARSPLSPAGSCEFSGRRFPAMEGVRGVLLAKAGKALIVIEDGLERAAIEHVIEAGHEWSARAEPPAVLPRRVFAYLIRSYNPFLYSSLLADRKVAFGADPLAEVPAPGRDALAASTRGQLANVLMFGRSEALLSPLKSPSLPDLEQALDRGMAIRLLIGDGWTARDRQDFASRWRSQFPECAAAFEEIKRHASEGRGKAAREAFFHLFRPMVRDILERIASAEGAQPAVPAGRFQKP